MPSTVTRQFVGWPKIHRLFRDVVVTEKIDGSNAAVCISEDGSDIWAQSRKRLITPDDDNFGFARWVEENREELLLLGPGVHHGEWYGAGIQRRYGLEDKRFMLFNTARWNAENTPACCETSTVLYEGVMDTEIIDDVIEKLRISGSQHVPGFPDPEGIVVYHTHSRTLFKVTLEKDEQHKFER